MADTGARTLRLLGLLQRRRWWPGTQLAEQLGVSVRTLRRDIDRLRVLGYTVTAAPGVDGGYRLEGGTGDTPLVADDDEAIAIALGLRLAAQSSDELAEVALGAVAKVVRSLTPERRRRIEALAAATSVGRWPEQSSAPPIEVLATVSGACQDQVRLSFSYRAADGASSERYVEPCGVVILGGRYYLVAFDLDRDDWRTFRLDRLGSPRAARNTFPSRPAPADDLADYVERSIRTTPSRTHLVIEVDGPGEDIRRRFGRWAHVTDLGPTRCRVTMEAGSLHGPMQFATEVGHDFRVIGPEDLRTRLAGVAARLARATAPTDPDDPVH